VARPLRIEYPGAMYHVMCAVTMVAILAVNLNILMTHLPHKSLPLHGKDDDNYENAKIQNRMGCIDRRGSRALDIIVTLRPQIKKRS
jgi:hypothetical protein